MIVDGFINWPEPRPPLAPGFDLDARKADVYEWVRQIRGGVLAGSFTVERNLSATIVFYFLGDRVLLQDVQDAFDQCVLNALTFERRINAVSTIAPRLIGADAAKALTADLGELKSIRNAMAHQPHWYMTQTNADGEVNSLVPFVRKGKKPLALTSAWVEETNAKMVRIIRETGELAEAAAMKSKAEGDQARKPA